MRDARSEKDYSGQDKERSGKLPMPTACHASSPGLSISVPPEATTRNYPYDVAAGNNDSRFDRG
jgi:hypothetical protein